MRIVPNRPGGLVYSVCWGIMIGETDPDSLVFLVENQITYGGTQMPIYETLFEGLIMPPMNQKNEVTIPKDSLAYQVHQLESNPADTHLRRLLSMLRLERNRDKLKTEPEALDNLFQIVEEIYTDYYEEIRHECTNHNP